jgi:hypothetical protein
MEVRFAGEQNVFRSFYHAVKDELDRVSLMSSDIPQNTFTTSSLSSSFLEKEK